MVYDNFTREKAIRLRKEGKTYSEILKIIPVAKSTLSEWFKEVKLSKSQSQELTKKKLEAARRGGEAKRKQRIERTKEIFDRAFLDVNKISKKELWLIGVTLYWAEGTKEKENHPGSQLMFGNTDSRMIRLFIKWLLCVCEISRDRFVFEIYIHENSKNKIENVRKYWSKITGFSIDNFRRVYYKKNIFKTNRKNIENLYYGLIRVKVKSSSTLVRQISGWTEAIYRNI